MKSEEVKFKELTKPEVIEFVKNNNQTSISKLILKGSPFNHIDIKSIVNQIVGKQKSKKKLPFWYKHDCIIYPPKLNLEQTSSEITAYHKSKFIEGHQLLDMTGGLGIDAYFFSKKIKSLIYLEMNTELYQISKHNFKVLNANNIEMFNQDSIRFLSESNQIYDWIYVDPSRRNRNEKVFKLNDSLPNVVEHLDLIESKSKNFMIKTSPMYDIEMGLRELKGVKEIHVVSVNNEVKDVLWILDWRIKNNRTIKVYNYKSDKRYSYTCGIKEENQKKDIELTTDLRYLYEFDSGIMKAGLNDGLALRYGLKKLELHTHIYTSDTKVLSIPGKIYKVEASNSINFKKLKKQLKGKQVNLISKNFHLSTTALQKKLNCKIGSDTDYLFFVKTLEGNKVIEAQRVL